MVIWIQGSISGLMMGGVYAIVSAGLSLIFGVMRIVNFAHGDFLMAAMYAVWGLVTFAGIDPYVSIFVIAPVFFMIGYCFQKFFINGILRKERNVESPNIRLFTVGFAWFLSNLALMVFKANSKVSRTAYMGKTFLIGQVYISQPRFYAFLIAVTATVLMWFFLQRSEMGRALRAVSQNRFTARLMGINVDQLYCIAFGIGIALVAIAACILIPFFYVYPRVGAVFGTKSFVIVVLGGMGSIPGAMIGGLFIGIAESLVSQTFGPSYGDLAVFLLFIIILLARSSSVSLKKRSK